MFEHNNISDDLIKAIQISEIEGGAWIEKLPVGKGLKVQTLNTLYTIRKDENGYTIQGHPKYCPEPVLCNIHGSTFGGSVIRIGFIGRGMHLEVGMPREGGVFTMTTSPIKEVEEIE